MNTDIEQIEMSLTDLGEVYKSLPDPNIWKYQIEKKILINGVDDTTNYYCSQGGIDFGFKLRHVDEFAVEWRPIQKIIIDNSDGESFKPCELISATHSDGTILSKDEVDEYNRKRGAL